MGSPKPPALVVIAGIDGSGKTTQAKLLVEALERRGYRARYLWNRWEPRLLAPASAAVRLVKGGRGATAGPAKRDTGEQLGLKRRLMRNRVLAWIWLRLAFVDYRLQAHRRLRDALASADVVVCDRYVYDFLVDQATNLGGDIGDLQRVFRQPETGRFLRPAVAVVIVVDPVRCRERKEDGLSPERLGARQELYREFVSLDGALEIPGDDAQETVAARMLAVVLPVLEERVNACV